MSAAKLGLPLGARRPAVEVAVQSRGSEGFARPSHFPWTSGALTCQPTRRYWPGQILLEASRQEGRERWHQGYTHPENCPQEEQSHLLPLVPYTAKHCAE